jgi:O-antigen/teichoic acid export membrane protein
LQHSFKEFAAYRNYNHECTTYPIHVLKEQADSGQAMVVTKKRFAVNVIMNWVAMVINMVIPFFMMPFVVHHLGVVQYGIWVLAASTTSYLSLLDLGLRSVIVRFVSKAHAQSNLDEAKSAISHALYLRMLVSGVVVVLSVLLAVATPYMFKKIPLELMHAAQITMLICALDVAITLLSGVFGAVLTSISRFDLLSSVSAGQTAFRAIGLLLILRSGAGLIPMAYWEFIVTLVAGSITVALALRTFPTSRTKARKPVRAELRALVNYSLTTAIFLLAIQVIINTDSIVIAKFLSVSLVTFYALGSSLVTYSSQVATAVSSTFVPLASGLEASGRPDELRKMLLRGTQGMLALTLPIALALFFRGQTFITIWMGAAYGQISETVLRILMLSLFFAMGDATAGAIMMAIDKHRPVAKWAVYEAVLNLGLSIVLAKTIGLYGVAWGTSISMALTHVLFYPRYNREVLGVPMRIYVWEGWTKVTLFSLPFGFVCYLADHYWHPANLVTFFSQILVTLPVYGICMLVLFRKEAAAWFQGRRGLSVRMST